MITIVDSGVSNIRSVENMLKKAGVEAVTSTDPGAIREATKLILPGVGAFNAGMKALRDNGLREVLDRKVLDEKTPVLGICLGMQLLAKSSEEGQEPGLGWIDADVVRFSFNGGPPRKVPHMGWNVVSPTRASPLFDGLDADARFYFVHSFYVRCRRESDVLGRTEYGFPFASAVSSGNVWGVQFHPEKSHRYGMALLKGFAAI